jgi:hypothetical protein
VHNLGGRAATAVLALGEDVVIADDLLDGGARTPKRGGQLEVELPAHGFCWLRPRREGERAASY